jgi:hypothetical protein
MLPPSLSEPVFAKRMTLTPQIVIEVPAGGVNF